MNKKDTVNKKPGQSINDSLPDIAGYDNNGDTNSLINRVFNKDRFTGYCRITVNNRKGNNSIEANRATKQD